MNTEFELTPEDDAPKDVVLPKLGQVQKVEEDHPPRYQAGASTYMTLLQRAVEGNVDTDRLDKLLDAQERWERNQARKAFDEAMAMAKAEIPTIIKNRVVDFVGKTGIRTHYKHEDLAEIARTIDPILGKYGLSYRFRTHAPIGEPVTVTCIVSHRMGHYEENTLAGPRDESGNKNAIQQVGSTITFLQRYTLKAALGLAASNDDDGRAAGSQVDTNPINDEQAGDVLRLIEETQTDIEKFCQYLGVESVPDITVSQLPRALAVLEKKKRATAAEERR